MKNASLLLGQMPLIYAADSPANFRSALFPVCALGFLAEFLFQVDHVGELHAPFKDGMVVVIREEVGDDMRAHKPALFIESEGCGAVNGGA